MTVSPSAAVRPAHIPSRCASIHAMADGAGPISTLY